jgi:hypothetical protein
MKFGNFIIPTAAHHYRSLRTDFENFISEKKHAREWG